jgi:6-phosphofructokinase 1
MYNILIAQSGGPTSAINASLAGVMEEAFKTPEIDKVYGGCNGIQGILEGRIIELNEQFEDNEENLEKLRVTPAMYLGSCRYKMKDAKEDTSDYERILHIAKTYRIGAFFYIGGNDSMHTVNKLSAYVKEKGIDIKVIGIPKTIDNDLMCIDHTPGFGSAAKYIATTVREIALDTCIYNMESVVIVEVMGRNAGWLTASAVLARNNYSIAPQLIYLPEVPFDMDDFIKRVKDYLTTYHHVIIVVSEGVKDKEGAYISTQGDAIDKFGHARLSGTGGVLKEVVESEIGCKVRSVELNVLQRSAGHLLSETDIEESTQLGKQGVRLAVEGKTSVMATLTRVGNQPYQVQYGYADVAEVANEERKIPLEWICGNGTDVTQEMIDYLRPLVLGEVGPSYKDGMPDYIFERVRRK